MTLAALILYFECRSPKQQNESDAKNTIETASTVDTAKTEPPGDGLTSDHEAGAPEDTGIIYYTMNEDDNQVEEKTDDESESGCRFLPPETITRCPLPEGFDTLFFPDTNETSVMKCDGMYFRTSDSVVIDGFYPQKYRSIIGDLLSDACIAQLDKNYGEIGGISEIYFETDITSKIKTPAISSVHQAFTVSPGYT